MSGFGWDSTLRELREYLRANYREGVDCPCCSQRVKLYQRRLNRGQAEMLIAIARETVRRRISPDHFPWIHVEHDLMETGRGPKRCRDFSVMRFWGLIEPFDSDDPFVTTAPGSWRLTKFGLWVVEHPDRPLLAEYVEVYNNRKRGESEKKITLRAALRRSFSLEEVKGRAA